MNILESIKNLFIKQYNYTNNIYPSYIITIIKNKFPRCKISLNNLDDNLYTLIEKKYIQSVLDKINMPALNFRDDANDCDDYVDRLIGRIKDFTGGNINIKNGIALGRSKVKNTVTNKFHKCLFFVDTNHDFHFIDVQNKNIHQMLSYIPYNIEF